MDILVLYSWETDNDKEDEAKDWAMGLCYELCSYSGVSASCDMLFSPKSNTHEDLVYKIHHADKIIVIVTNSYIKRIEQGVGVVSFEEREYRKRIKNEFNTNNILFLMKEKNITMPKGWETYRHLDFSWVNKRSYPHIPQEQRQERFGKIVQFFSGTPEYKITPVGQRRDIPEPKTVIPFDELFGQDCKVTYREQEASLIDLIKKNLNQEAFIYEYIRSGLSADINLNGRMTPDVFVKNFLVKRSHDMEKKINNTVGQLFHDRLHNMLCVQSDGGSGKSVFLHTLYQRDEKKGRQYIYRNIFVDLSNLHKNFASKEDILFQRFKKEYRRMTRLTPENKSYNLLWQQNFTECLNNLKVVSFPENSDMFKLYDFQKSITEAVDILLPNGPFEEWYNGFSKRIHSLKEHRKEDQNILFTIILLLYVIILNCRPQRDKNERFLIIFDNIETYDNGEDTRRIAEFIHSCHSFLETIFNELGKIDEFFTKFSFVIVLRTSTLVSFGNLQTNIWGGNRYIVHLRYTDFAVGALLKKLKFLKIKIRNVEQSILYKELYNIVSLLVPATAIDNYIKSEDSSEDIDVVSSRDEIQLRHFTSNQLLPMFNNNFRMAMEYLYQAYFSEEYHNTIINALKDADSHQNAYEYAINGIRMMIFRYVFDDFRRNGYFNDIGFPDLYGIEDHSMTRMILAYLYWDNVKNYALRGCTNGYKGVTLKRIVDTFKYFCDGRKLSSILFGLSIFTNKKPEKKSALNAWGNLLIFDNCEEALDEDRLNELVQSCFEQKPEPLARTINIRLSNAGQSFTIYYIRSFEFLEARNQRHSELPALFQLTQANEIRTCLSDIRTIIRNCIEKLINSCKSSCVLYCDRKHECFVENENCDDYMFFSCSLFVRYQECLDFIRESIDYIDRYRRYRIEMSSEKNLFEVNDLLLDQISDYYKLYDEVKKELCSTADRQQTIENFIKKWTHSSNLKLKLASKGYNDSERTRPIQSYYARSDENFEKAIEIVRQAPKKSLYNVIMDMSLRPELSAFPE